MTTEQTEPPKNKLPLPVRANGVATEGPLDGLSDDAILARIAAARSDIAVAERELEQRKAKREADFLASVAETARAYNIPPARVLAAIRGTVATAPGAINPNDRRHFVKPLLWNPKNHAQRWSKRGAPPKWYADHIAAGGTEAECAIPEDEV
jgi:hypothetical protein